MIRITFLGGAGTVTGSKYLVEAAGRRILVDCGLFQGYKLLRLRNWRALPVEPASLDAVVLSHAHLDHSGYIPLLVRNGFSGRIFCTGATAALCDILLPDSGFLMEREAEYANREGFSKHRPALPLYTVRDARAALERFSPVPFHADHALGGGLTLRLLRAGHILGAAIVVLTVGTRTLAFSGDLGRFGSPTMHDPELVRRADCLLVESTYGNRRHDTADPEDALAGIVTRTAARGGTVIIPSFAVGRAQTLLYHLHRLKQSGRIGNVPVFLDSPMAIDASEIFCRFHADHRLTEAAARAACGVARYVQTVEESKSLDHNHVPRVIVAASGMATGGRVVHHLKALASDPRNTILFAGFQAGGRELDELAATGQEGREAIAGFETRAAYPCRDLVTALVKLTPGRDLVALLDRCARRIQASPVAQVFSEMHRKLRRSVRRPAFWSRPAGATVWRRRNSVPHVRFGHAATDRS